MELKDTVELMQSNDYKDRFKAEYYQLKIRYMRLLNVLVKSKDNKLGYELTYPIELLHEQIHAMKRYMADLEGIAEFEKIKL